MGVRSILIRNNPVSAFEDYRLTLVEQSSSVTEAEFTNFKREKKAEAGYWTVSFDIRARLNILLELFEMGIDREVQAWGDGLEQAFEGTIFELVLHLPPDRYTKSIEPVANTMWMRTDYDADGEAERTTTLTSDQSVARFGTIEHVISGGEMPSLGVADQAVQSLLNLKDFPRPDAVFGGGQPEMKLEVFCRGWVNWFERQRYNQTASTGQVSLTSIISSIITATGGFVAATELDTNTTLIQEEYDNDRKGFDLLIEIPRVGDASYNRWLLRMVGQRATDAVGRRAVLREAAPAVAPA